MKKNTMRWMAMLCMAVLCLGFAACGDDDEEDNGGSNSEMVERLQGTWEFVKGTETVMGYTVNINKQQLDEIASQIHVSIWDETLTFRGSKVNGAPYKVKGEQIVMDGMEEFGMTVKIKSLTTSELVLHETITLEGMSIVADLEYERK